MRYELRSEPWEAWFAWRPVKTVGDKWYWLKNIYRKSGYDDWLDIGSWNWYFYADDFDVINEANLVEQIGKQLKELRK